ncbi:hypothetical protein TRICI_002575 [Trichomonascus ciferrii]|uniref:Queuosine 5'-phosphate N-glycosylase/hydrolase n=1 Tax=Trichomonascus ciferrii TaxID=44093 RepID=A0A642V5D1_9ASCO|nr:hypothetical protein TRICI_002575 [Trichomonascus ciferrii]
MIRESARFVVGEAEHVIVDEAGCKDAAQEVLKEMHRKDFSVKTWSSHELTPKEKNKATVDWIFTVDLLNFSFWSSIDSEDTGKSESERYSVEYKGKLYTGYWSLVAAINKALDNGIPITTPSFWLSENFPEVAKKVFRSENREDMPMFDKRIEVLQEAGKTFERMGYTSFTQFVELAQNSAQTLIGIVIENFSSFNDTHSYKNHEVKIMKRVQILTADIWACFEGKDYGKFDDIDTITMFADYRVPQILHTLGCLKYSEQLESRIRKLELLPSGDPMEVELRACSIWAVELIVNELRNLCPPRAINSILVDFYLWDTAKELQQQFNGIGNQIPCHRTRSVFY